MAKKLVASGKRVRIETKKLATVEGGREVPAIPSGPNDIGGPEISDIDGQPSRTSGRCSAVMNNRNQSLVRRR